MTNFEFVKAILNDEEITEKTGVDELARYIDKHFHTCRMCAYKETDKCDTDDARVDGNPICIEGISKWMEQEAKVCLTN